MATLTATRYDRVLEAFYQNLLRHGKETKVALTACMRKFLSILDTMLREKRPWQPELAPTWRDPLTSRELLQRGVRRAVSCRNRDMS